MRFTILLVIAFAAFVFAKPHPRKDSSSEEDRKHKGPHKHHDHHHRRTFRPRPTIPKSITTPAEPEQSSQLPVITTSAAEIVVTDVVTSGSTFVPDVVSTEGSLTTKAVPEPSTGLPAVITSASGVVVTDDVASRITFIPGVLSTEGSIITQADFDPSTNIPEVASTPGTEVGPPVTASVTTTSAADVVMAGGWVLCSGSAGVVMLCGIVGRGRNVRLG
ncbi:unnamed protein product [Strongylus vulgaris]|uniref:Uncharacterized protein n=1 Tax=Strongylus vulgaris TaxID=40348 RepID=A0A3P7LCE3_STRVU|nr:unnamed protein product [Strongylus vulgaris]